MHMAALIVALLVALLHIYILISESFRWGTPAVNKTFGVTPEQAAIMKPMAANMGLYNGFLAAGLIWGLIAGDTMMTPILTFFLACVAIAGIVGTLTTGNRRIVVIQTVPAVVGLVLLLV
jgi:putative membrane protein